MLQQILRMRVERRKHQQPPKLKLYIEMLKVSDFIPPQTSNKLEKCLPFRKDERAFFKSEVSIITTEDIGIYCLVLAIEASITSLAVVYSGEYASYSVIYKKFGF